MADEEHSQVAFSTEEYTTENNAYVQESLRIWQRLKNSANASNLDPQNSQSTQYSQAHSVNSCGDEDIDELLIQEVQPFRCLWDTKCRKKLS